MVWVKLWSEGYKCTKKGIFCRTESVTMTPKSRDPMPTVSLWGVAAKWPTRAPKMKLKWYFAWETHKDTAVSVWACQAGFWEYRYSMGFAKLYALKCSLHKWAWCGAARKSAHLNCINWIHFCLTAGRLHGSLCIVIPGVVCELIQFAATQ